MLTVRRTLQVILVLRLTGESLGDEWRSARRQRFGANTPWSGNGWIVLDSLIDFCWTWSFTFSSNHSIIANGWTLSEQMAINLTGLIPLRYLSRMSAASSSLHFTWPGIAVHKQRRQQKPCKHWRHNTWWRHRYNRTENTSPSNDPCHLNQTSLRFEQGKLFKHFWYSL